MKQATGTGTVPIGQEGARGHAWVCDGPGPAVLADQATGLDAVTQAVRSQVDPR